MRNARLAVAMLCLSVLAISGLALTTVAGAGRAGAAGKVFASAANGSPLMTAVQFFEPYTDTGLSASVKVRGHATGSCFAGSLVVADPDAWRCIAGDQLLDPCFAPPAEAKPATLACGSPWTGVTMLELSGRLPGGLADRASAPTAGWLLQLANGSRCELSQGAAGLVEGVAVAYLCSHGAAAGALDWSAEPWSVRYLQAGRARPSRVDVSVAWGG